ncbi:MAG: L-2-amino-thiazoline-4-carboxylic acid hydrolase [Candidatus Hermodarchaeota archaeon]
MLDKNVKNYYTTNKASLMKQFELTLEISKDILMERFNKSKSEALINQMRKEYEDMIIQMTDIGGGRNPFISTLTSKVSLLVIFRNLEKEGYTYREIGEFSNRYKERETKMEMDRAKRSGGDLSEVMFGEFYIKTLKRYCKNSQKKKYPDDWVMLFVDGTNEEFDFGLNISECGILKAYKKLGAEKYAPFACLLDFAHAHVLGYGLSRTKTIANGASGCDHRYTRNGSTPKAWPPDNIKEYTKKFE